MMAARGRCPPTERTLAVYRLDSNAHTVIVVRIEHRADVYRRQ